jgi:hypothetical protein
MCPDHQHRTSLMSIFQVQESLWNVVGALQFGSSRKSDYEEPLGVRYLVVLTLMVSLHDSERKGGRGPGTAGRGLPCGQQGQRRPNYWRQVGTYTLLQRHLLDIGWPGPINILIWWQLGVRRLWVEHDARLDTPNEWIINMCLMCVHHILPTFSWTCVHGAPPGCTRWGLDAFPSAFPSILNSTLYPLVIQLWC